MLHPNYTKDTEKHTIPGRSKSFSAHMIIVAKNANNIIDNDEQQEPSVIKNIK